MSEVIAGNYTLFDGFEHTKAPHIAYDILSVADIAMRFANIERVPRYSCSRRENNAEHSFMLGLAGMEIAARYFPDIDTGLVAQFAMVHDLPELPGGDIATFTLSKEEIAQKEANERSAATELAPQLPPYIGWLMLEYEKQELPAARLTRFIDKELPVSVDILGPGTQVMREDYGITTSEQLAANAARLSGDYREKFADPAFGELHDSRDILAAVFAAKFELEANPKAFYKYWPVFV